MGTVVQDQSSTFQSGVSSSWAIAFGSNITAGNLIYCWGGAGGDASGTIPTDTLTHTYVLIRHTYDATNNQSHTTWYAKNTSSGANTVTLAASYQGAGTSMGVLEISGLHTTTPLDGTVEVGAVDTTTNGTDVASGGTLVTGSASDFLVCAMQNINEAEVGTLTISAGTSYTGNTKTGTHIGKMQTRQVSSTGSYLAAFTGNADQRSTIHGVAFKDAAQPEFMGYLKKNQLRPRIFSPGHAR